MKILAIRLKNLTSIEGAVEVDFAMEPLNSAGIPEQRLIFYRFSHHLIFQIYL